MKRILFALLATLTTSTAQTYQENGGLVIIEAENTPSSLDLWQEMNSLSGYSGDGYLQFLGNNFSSGPATSPLEYTFQINQAGIYYLHLHCAKETHDGRTDVANDCYVRVEGDYNAGPEPHTGHGDNASLSLLKSDTKYFGGATDTWKWENGQDSSGGNGNLDPGGESNKRVAVYNFKAGETYKLVLSGRSKSFRINRIVFRHQSTSASEAQDLSTPESETSTGSTDLVYQARADFPSITAGDVPYYKDNGNNALAIAANIPANRVGYAQASRTFDGATGLYDVTITTVTEEDGESTYRLLVNGVQMATFTNPFIGEDSPLDLQPHTHTWRGVQIATGAAIAIESNADSNDQVSENGDGNPPWAWARGRWRQIEFSVGNSLIKPPLGRVAIVADGNSPDPDDIGATAVMFGILNGAGLNDRLVHLSHSCDLDPFSNPGNQSIDATNELRRQNKLHALSGEGVNFFGPFPNLADHFNCRIEQAAAVNDLRDAIDASTADDPLWIIEAGEPDIIGYALQAADSSKRQYVHIISHHPANDNSGDFFTWAQILAFGVTEHQIGDQNVGLQVQISSGLWDWAENHPQPELAWIWDQLKYAEQDGVVGFQSNKFDCSDAGMLYWWLSGATNGGNRNSTPTEMRNLLLFDQTGPIAHWPMDEGSGTSTSDATGNGFNGTLINGATWGTDATRDSYVSFDGTDDRISTTFTYTLSASDDFTWAWWANQQSTGTIDDGAIMLGNRYPQPGAGGDSFEFIKLTPTHGQFSDTNDTSQIERHQYGSIAQGTWHHYSMVKSGTSYHWYIDGVAQGAPVTINYDEDTPLPFFIGGDDNGSGKVNEHFQGYIDDVVLYRRALTASEVSEVRDGSNNEQPTIGVMTGESADADARNDGVIVNLGAAQLVPGRSGANGGFDRSTVLVFKLPDLGETENPFISATLEINIENVSASPPGVDLYGLGKRSSPTVLTSDYYGENASVDPSDATLLQNNFLTTNSETGYRSSTADTALAAYLNAQYADGNGIGHYVFLRLSSNAPISGLQRHFITSADGIEEDRPKLTYTVQAADDFESWRGSYNFPNGADTSPEADPDGDGLSTWFEYLFGLNPNDATSVEAIDPGSIAVGILTYTRRNPALSGVSNYEVWSSADLNNWSHDTEAVQVPNGNGEVQEVTVTLSPADQEWLRHFIQIRATN